jgi:hypothetical protein
MIEQSIFGRIIMLVIFSIRYSRQIGFLSFIEAFPIFHSSFPKEIGKNLMASGWWDRNRRQDSELRRNANAELIVVVGALALGGDSVA